ncbi:helix-turn-helix domain-containing protein [Nocardia sp. NPDC001965]
MVGIDWTAQDIRALRESLRLSPTEFARVVGVTKRTVLLWEQERTKTLHASSRRLLDQVLTQAEPRTVERFEDATGRGQHLVSAEPEVKDDMRRRDLIACIGAGVAGQMADSLMHEPGRMTAALDVTSVSERRLDYFDALTSDLGRRVVQVPPRTLLSSALDNFRAVRACLSERQATYNQIRLVRVAGRLANVVAEILFNEGYFDEARHWYMTAIHAFQDIGDRYSEDIALAGLSYLPTYSADPIGALAVLSPRLAQKPMSGAAVAWLWGMAGRAHAVMGDEDEFRLCIANAATALDSASPDEIELGIFSFRPEKLAFYEAIGHSRFGRTDQTSVAAHRALSMYDPTETTEPCLVRLEYASALLAAGEVDEACAVATQALTNDRTYLATSVTGRARRFDADLRGVNSRAVSAWREQARPALEAVKA